VIWSAYITAAARIKLHKSMTEETLYCDTDSILSETPVPESKELGDLSLVGMFRRIRIILPKLYEFETFDGSKKQAAKGIPTSPRRTSDDLSEFERELGIKQHEKDSRLSPAQEIFMSNALSVSFKKPNRYIESLRRGLKINAWEKRTKGIRSDYDKRFVRPDGTTEPLEVRVRYVG
jgi:hypothetical protein